MNYNNYNNRIIFILDCIDSFPIKIQYKKRISMESHIDPSTLQKLNCSTISVLEKDISQEVESIRMKWLKYKNTIKIINLKGYFHILDSLIRMNILFFPISFLSLILVSPELFTSTFSSLQH